MGQADRAMQTFVDSVPIVEEQLVKSYAREIEACPDAACEASVDAAWEPVKVTMQALHDAWCAVAPEAENC